jgi:uncharacterized membrane protein
MIDNGRPLKKFMIVGAIILLLCSTLLSGKGVFEMSTDSLIIRDEEMAKKSTRGKYDLEDVKEAIERGLTYLNDTKLPDGAWYQSGWYGKNTNMVGSCLRAFVDYNATDPRWQDAIEGGVRFLRYVWHDPADYPAGSQRDNNGGALWNDRFAPNGYSHGKMYSQGSATSALIDYYFHTQDISLLPYINESVALIVRAQNTPRRPNTMNGPRSEGGWRYTPDYRGSDTSLSGWNIHAIVLAESSGIYDVPDDAFEYSVKWLKSVSSGSGFGYSSRSTRDANTAVGLYCMYLLGQGETPEAQGALRSVLNWGPRYRVSSFYFTYHATIAMYLVGGEEWKNWNEEIQTALLDSQNQDGSWNGDYGIVWGTAMAIACLNLGISRPNEVALSPQKDPVTGEEEPMVKLVEPEHTVTYNISVGSELGFVENPLSKPYQEADTVELTITEPLPGWSAELETPNTPDDGLTQPDGSKLWWVELEMKEMTNITLKVTAPPLGRMSEPCVVNVIAKLENEYGVTQSKIATISILDIDVDFNLEFLADRDEFTGNKIGDIAPGERKVFQAVLNNKGNVNDTYDISLVSPSNWKVFFDNAGEVWNLTLGKEGAVPDAAVINVTIEAPITASKGEIVDITILGTSTMYGMLGLGSLKRSDQLSLTVTGLPALVMSCVEDNKHVNPGEIVKYEIFIINNYDSTLDVTFSFYGTGTLIDSLQVFANNWSGGFPAKNFAIKSRERLKVIFQVAAPTYARSGTRKVIEIRAIGYDNFGMEYEAQPISVTAIANLVAKISANAEPSEQRCYPGNDVNYTITVNNEGNGEDIADLQIYDLPIGWEYEFESTSNFLSPFEEVPVELKIIVPANALADSDPRTPALDPYRIGINITGREKMLGYGETLYVNLWVEKISKFRITTIESNKFASPRSTCDFTFRLDNLGNAIDLAKLNISRDLLNDEWEVYFPYLSLNHKMDSLSKIESANFSGEIDIQEFKWDVLYIPREDSFDALSLKLDVGQSVYIGLNVEIPEVKSGENVSFSVEAWSEGGVEIADNTLKFTIEIIMPDLFIIGKITSTKLTVGKIASFTATIGNKGELPAENVEITLYVDKKEVDTRNLPRIVVGDKKLVTFVWPVSEGEHNVKVAVDPNNDIAETDETNNVKNFDKDIDVDAPGSTVLNALGGSSPMLVFIIILIGLSGAAIVYTVHHFKNRF